MSNTARIKWFLSGAIKKVEKEPARTPAGALPRGPDFYIRFRARFVHLKNVTFEWKSYWSGEFIPGEIFVCYLFRKTHLAHRPQTRGSANGRQI